MMKKSCEQKTKASLAYGRDYIVFDRDGIEYATIRGRSLSQALAHAKICGGDVWLSGKCVVPASNVHEDAE